MHRVTGEEGPARELVLKISVGLLRQSNVRVSGKVLSGDLTCSVISSYYCYYNAALSLTPLSSRATNKSKLTQPELAFFRWTQPLPSWKS